MLSRPTSFYSRALKPDLPAVALQPVPSRLLWLPLHLSVIVGGIICLAERWLHWGFAPLISLIIGASFAGLTFLGHETLHGAVVRGRTRRRLIGGLCFAPFAISQRLWVAWHNRVHHGHTNHSGADPDAYPTLEEYRRSRALRFVTDHLGPGGSRPNGVLSLMVGFSVQSTHMLLRARAFGLLSASQHRAAWLETAVVLLGWLGLALWVGWPVFLFAWALPLMVANAVVMAFILTNHSLSPHTDVNDPLLNSLSVTVPGWMDRYTLGFGYHVEHHLFPWMSSRHAPAVRDLILARWSERYQSMPLQSALVALHRTGRVYKDATTLSDVRDGKEWPTLLPREAGAAPAAARVHSATANSATASSAAANSAEVVFAPR